MYQFGWEDFPSCLRNSSRLNIIFCTNCIRVPTYLYNMTIRKFVPFSVHDYSIFNMTNIIVPPNEI